jgi:predicted MFS family arabinose efflux permease
MKDTVSMTRHSNWALALLTCVYLVNAVDRQIISVVMEPIRHEFNASDKMLGATALGYSIAFALTCLPVGWLIDRTRRVRLLAALLAAWSGLTALSGFATSFVFLLLARAGVGAAEAGASPTIISLISDYFEPRRRSFAIGVCYMSTAFGVSASFLIGSLVASAHGWRAAFWVAGIPGLLLAGAIVSTLREPERGASDSSEDSTGVSVVPPLFGALAHIRRDRALLHLTIAITLSALVFASLWIWCGSILIRFHRFSLPEVGRLVAVGGLFQAAGSWLGGYLGQYAAKRSTANFGYVAAICAFMAVPFGIVFALSTSTVGAVIGVCGMSLFNGGWTGPGFGLVVTVAPAPVRGIVVAFIQLFVNLIGAGVGPFLTGAMSDSMPGGLQGAVSLTFALNLWSGVHYLIATKVAKRTLPKYAPTPETGSAQLAH